jgi:hypothetical protein
MPSSGAMLSPCPSSGAMLSPCPSSGATLMCAVRCFLQAIAGCRIGNLVLLFFLTVVGDRFLRTLRPHPRIGRYPFCAEFSQASSVRTLAWSLLTSLSKRISKRRWTSSTIKGRKRIDCGKKSKTKRPNVPSNGKGCPPSP